MPSVVSRAVAYVFVAIFMLAGPALLLVDAVVLVRNLLFIYSAARTQGTIVALKQFRARSSRKQSFAPVFRFTADDGQAYIVASNMFNKTPGFAVGEQVTVLYEKGHPEHAKVDSFYQLWIPEIVLSVVGGGFSVIPAVIIVRRRRQPRN